MADVGLIYLIFGIIGGFGLLLIGAAITRAIFSIGTIVRLLAEIADSLAKPEEKEDKEN